MVMLTAQILVSDSRFSLAIYWQKKLSVLAAISAMLVLLRPAAASFYFFFGGACANRSSSPRGFSLRVFALALSRRQFLSAIRNSSRLTPLSAGNALRFCEPRGDLRAFVTRFRLV